MSSLGSPSGLAAATVACLLLVAGRVAADNNDDAARRLAKAAIFDDYLSTNFDDAQKKLEMALELCKKDCNKRTIAIIHRNYGVVLIAGLSQPKEGKQHFLDALSADPKIGLDADLATRDTQAAFEQARKQLGITGPTTPDEPAKKPSENAATPKPEAGAKPNASEGGLLHEPVAEQAVRTPVPIFVEVPDDIRATTVLVRYKPFGGAWKTLELRPLAGGYGGEISCDDVGTTGELRYYVQAQEGTDVVAFAGTRSRPHRVPIRNQLEADAPRLPGQSPPTQCMDSGECPPGMPGCGDAGSCMVDADCDDGRSCVAGKCDAGSDAIGEGAKKNWLSLSFQQDVLFFSSQQRSCSGGNDLNCFFENPDTYYEELPYEESGGEIAGGPVLATQRVLLGYDRMFGAISAGARLGFAFGGGPQAPGGNAFFPLHAELRGAWWPLSGMVRPYLLLSAGVAQVDGKVIVTIFQDEEAFNEGETTKLAAWKAAGTGFAGAGLGTLIAFSDSSALGVEAKLTQMFGTSGLAGGLSIGYHHGL